MKIKKLISREILFLVKTTFLNKMEKLEQNLNFLVDLTNLDAVTLTIFLALSRNFN